MTLPMLKRQTKTTELQIEKSKLKLMTHKRQLRWSKIARRIGDELVSLLPFLSPLDLLPHWSLLLLLLRLRLMTGLFPLPAVAAAATAVRNYPPLLRLLLL